MSDEEVDDFTRKLVEFMRPIIREFMKANFEDFCRKPEPAVTDEMVNAALNAWFQVEVANYSPQVQDRMRAVLEAALSTERGEVDERV